MNLYSSSLKKIMSGRKCDEDVYKRQVLLCEKPLADAVGLGLDVNEPTGAMIVDIGADTTEISVISLGGLVLSCLLYTSSQFHTYAATD